MSTPLRKFLTESVLLIASQVACYYAVRYVFNRLLSVSEANASLSSSRRRPLTIGGRSREEIISRLRAKQAPKRSIHAADYETSVDVSDFDFNEYEEMILGEIVLPEDINIGFDGKLTVHH